VSLTQAAECVGLKVQNASDFLRSNAFKSLAGEGYTPQIFEIESTEPTRGQSRIRSLPLEVVTIYWVWQCYRGNKQALSLVTALATESLERRFDEVFEVTRSEQERNEMLNQRVRRLERELEKLGESARFDIVLRDERDYFERLLRENGIDPWGIPEQEGER
jgi:hypothetical protein